MGGSNPDLVDGVAAELYCRATWGGARHAISRDSKQPIVPEGFLQADAYAGYYGAFESGQAREAACHAHRTRVRDLGASFGLGLGKASRSNGACRSSRSRPGMQAQR